MNQGSDTALVSLGAYDKSELYLTNLLSAWLCTSPFVSSNEAKRQSTTLAAVLGSFSKNVGEAALRMLQRSTRDMYRKSGSKSPNFGSRAATSPDV